MKLNKQQRATLKYIVESTTYLAGDAAGTPKRATAGGDYPQNDIITLELAGFIRHVRDVRPGRLGVGVVSTSAGWDEYQRIKADDVRNAGASPIGMHRGIVRLQGHCNSTCAELNALGRPLTPDEQEAYTHIRQLDKLLTELLTQ